MLSPRRTAAVVGGVVAVAAVAAFVVPTVVRSATAPLPADASALRVAHTFWAAAEHRDCRAMRALSDPADTRWCVPWWDALQGADPHLGHHSRFSAAVGPDGEVDVTFRVAMRGVAGAEDGYDAWGLELRRTPLGWRVAGEGAV